MGTSQSSPGPNGRSPLIPPWADDQPQQPQPSPEPARFRSFRVELGRFAGGAGSESLKSALGHYASKSTGGGGTATRKLGTTTQTGANLFGALVGGSLVTETGGNLLNLAELSGQPCETAISAIVQALTPNNGDADKIRSALNHALAEALDGVEIFDANHITDEVIVNTMIGFLSESIFLQIVHDGGKAWNKAETPAQAMNAERDLRELVKITVDKYMAPKIKSNTRALSRVEILKLEKDVIISVWGDWEKYI